MKTEKQEIKERPILFRGAMVRAILEGRKTQTRRVVKMPGWATPGSLDVSDIGVWASDPLKGGDRQIPCPYGAPGDRLWVKETHRYSLPDSIRYQADGACVVTKPPQPIVIPNHKLNHWRPSIFMHRWASRILLEVVGVRVERIAEISEADALAEGVAIDRVGGYHVAGYEGKWVHARARGCMETLWNTIHGPEAFHKVNPWVWVVEFKVLSTGGGEG